MAKSKTIDIMLLEPVEITRWRREKLQEAKNKVEAKAKDKQKRDKAKKNKARKNTRAKRASEKQVKAKVERIPWPEAAGTVGVYGILHKDTNSIYVGYTVDKNGFKWRWKRHKAQLFRAKTHHCKILQQFVLENKLRPRDFELVIFTSYPSRPRTQKLCDLIVKEEVLFWDKAQEMGFNMLCERPLGVRRTYTRLGKND